jgi:RNA polymerase primary sigma factor
LQKFLSEIGKTPLLSRQEEIELAEKIKLGDKNAREVFINSNLRLVVFVAKRYPEGHLKFLDHIQAGSEGLLKAINGFNPNIGFKFSTYAIWWIRQAIERSIGDNSRIIRLPIHIGRMLFKIQMAQKELELLLGHSPSNFEISRQTGIKEEKVKYLLSEVGSIKSLNDFILDEKGSKEFGEMIEDERSFCPEKNSRLVQLSEKLREAMGNLGEIEREVFSLRVSKNLSHFKISRKLGIPESDVKRAYNSALEKLSTNKELKEYAL